jgi:hypothetical protein
MGLRLQALGPHMYLIQPDKEQKPTSTAVQASTHDSKANAKVRLNWKEGNGLFH